MAIDSLYKADLLADLIGQIAADMGSEKIVNRQAHNDALLSLIGGASVASFLDIGDTPNDYTGMAGWLLSVTPSEDGLDFIDPSTFLTVVATDGTLTGDGTAGSPLSAVSGGATFLSLSDTPGAYAGAGMILQINATNDGLEFVSSAASSNVYVTDDSLTGNRIVDGDGFSFTINNTDSLTLQSAGSGVRIEDTAEGAYITVLDEIFMTPQASTTTFTLGPYVQFATDGNFDVDLSGGAGNARFISNNTGWMNIMANANPDTNILAPINGVLSYDSTDHEFRGYINGAWIDLATGPTLYNGDGTVGPSRMVAITDSILWTGTSKYTYTSGANTIASGTGLSPIGFGLVGNLSYLTTAASKTDSYWGGSITGGGHPQGAGHAENYAEVYNGARKAGYYLGPYSATETYASLFYTPDGVIANYKGFEANPNGERLYSQNTVLVTTPLPGAFGIMFVEAGGYLRAASAADLVSNLTIPLDKVLGDGNASLGNDILMGTDSIYFGGAPGADPRLFASGTDFRIDAGSSLYNMTMSAGAASTQLRFHGNGGINVGVIRLSKNGGTNYTTIDVSHTVNRNVTFQDASGTVALLSDIPASTGNGIYDGSDSLTAATVVTMSAANSITWSGGRSNFKGADALHGTLVISVVDSGDLSLFEITNGGSLKGNNPGNHVNGAFSFRSGNSTANVTDGSAFSLEASDNTVLWDVSAAGAQRVLGNISISDSTLKAQIEVITNSSTTAGVFHNVGASATGYAIHAIAEDNIAIVAEVNGAGASNTSIFADANVVIGGTQPVGGASGTSRLQVTGSTTGTEWGIQTKDGAGITGFSINNDGVGVARNYTVATVPTSVAGGIIYVTNESGGATLCYGDGATWRRIYDSAVIS